LYTEVKRFEQSEFDGNRCDPARFNQEVLDSPKVRYFSIAGSFEPPRVLGVPVGVLSLTHDIVRNKEGDNDGFTCGSRP